MDPVTLQQAIITGVLIGSVYGVLTLSLDIIYGVLDIVNIAHGDIIMLAMYLTFFLYTIYNVNLFALIVLVPVTFAILGIPAYLGVFKHLVGKTHDWHILYTAALGLVLQNLALVLWSSDPRGMENPYRGAAFELGPLLINQAQFIAFVLSITGTVLVFLLLYKTDWGLIIRGTMDNRRVVSIIGVDPHKIYRQAFCLGLGLAGFGGAILMIYYAVAPTVGNVYTIFMWTALVLGGPGTIKGSLIGAMIVGLSQVISGVLLPLNFQHIVAICLFIAMAALRPQGLLGKKT